MEAADVALVLPHDSVHFEGELFGLIREFEAAGENVVPYGLHYGENTFSRILARSRDFEAGQNIPDHMVLSTTWWLVRREDRRLLGAVNVRHSLNDFLLEQGGHIGYGIRPGERRKGYATQLLALTLEQCPALGIRRALVTCDKSNTGSARVIQKNGGILEDERLIDGEWIQRYWIDIP